MEWKREIRTATEEADVAFIYKGFQRLFCDYTRMFVIVKNIWNSFRITLYNSSIFYSKYFCTYTFWTFSFNLKAVI